MSIEDDVKSWTLDELIAAQSVLIEQGIAIDDDGDLVKFADSKGGVEPSPIEAERNRVMRSTFSSEQGEHDAVNFDRTRWNKPEVRRKLRERITKLSEAGDDRSIASAASLIKTYNRLSTGCPSCDTKTAHEDDCTNPARVGI